MNNIPSESLSQMARLAVTIRGVLAEPTDDMDNPFRPVILRFDTQTSRDPQTVTVDCPADEQQWSNFRTTLVNAVDAFVAAKHAQSAGVCVSGVGTWHAIRESTNASAPLRGKIALVTGAAGAIGFGVVQALLENGCRVAVTDLAGDNLNKTLRQFTDAFGDQAIGIPMDVTNASSVAAAFQQVACAWGGVDIAIVNAGIAHVAALVDLPLATFQKLQRVNVEGTLLTISEASRLLIRQATGGDIVLISTKNVFAPGAGFGAYSATKAASHQLARIASLELAEHGIRVNMVAPDAVFSGGDHKSGLWAAVGPDRMRARNLDEKGLEEYYRGRNLLKARVTARHVANAVLFFVTHQTPTTGATIPVDGGLPDATPR